MSTARLFFCQQTCIELVCTEQFIENARNLDISSQSSYWSRITSLSLHKTHQSDGAMAAEELLSLKLGQRACVCVWAMNLQQITPICSLRDGKNNAVLSAPSRRGYIYVCVRTHVGFKCVCACMLWKELAGGC